MTPNLRYSTLAKPSGTWWVRLGRDEKLWVGLTVIWGLSMFLMIVFVWPTFGKVQNEIRSYKVDPVEFRARTDRFIQQYRVGEVDGVPVVAPPAGGEVYVEALAFAWRPVVQLQKGKTYKFYLSSRDVQHGFSLISHGRSINYQVLPGFVSVVELTPEEAGDFPIACNEYCGLGHHTMLGRVVVVD